MAQAVFLPDGRLHLQDGPIDCLVRAWGDADELRAAYRQAAQAFPVILPELCTELGHLRAPLPSLAPSGAVARAMHAAVAPYALGFITPMAAVAGAVADRVLAALVKGRTLARAFVNNGGDIAFHLAAGESLRAGLVTDLTSPALDGAFLLQSSMHARGLATSGRACKGNGGRSFSLGIADSVSVLARSAAQADAAATVIGNAVDLPDHPAVMRRPAAEIDPDSDLGEKLVTWELGTLETSEIASALEAGRRVANDLHTNSLIEGAVLCLRGQIVVVSVPALEFA